MLVYSDSRRAFRRDIVLGAAVEWEAAVVIAEPSKQT